MNPLAKINNEWEIFKEVMGLYFEDLALNVYLSCSKDKDTLYP